MTKQDAELSPLARQLLGSSGAVKLFTQTEFNAALNEAKAEIMAIAIQTSKQAIAIEREECAKILDANAMACESPIMRSLLQSNAQAIRVRGQT